MFFVQLIITFSFLRPSFCKVLPSLQFLDGEILNYNTLPTTKRIKKSESSTFMELCQLQIEENVLLKKKAAELRYVCEYKLHSKICFHVLLV